MSSGDEEHSSQLRLKHQPPHFRYFDPVLEEQMTVCMREVKLPRAAETHEVCFEPVSRCVFITQMSNSVLVRIPVGPDGMLCDDQDAWHVGPAHPVTGDGISGLHNVSLSPANPGCIWLSLQFANTVVLVDASTMATRQVLRVPTMHTREDGSLVRIGGPHCVRECGKTGDIWVALKGSVPCHPGVTGSPARSLATAITRVCCNAAAIRERMAAHPDGEDEALAALPEGYAIWRINPKHYNPLQKPECGGRIYPCEPSPPMMAIDANCDCWVVQDKTPAILRIDQRSHVAEQIPVPLPEHWMQMTGPAVVTAPDGTSGLLIINSERISGL